MPSGGDFDERIDFLSREVGYGPLVAGCLVDQPYAQNQHENVSFKHERGVSHYLGDPLFANAFNFVDGLARAAIGPEGSRIKEEMRDIAEDMAGFVEKYAPKDPDIGDALANSGSPYVTDAGREIYRRPPKHPRHERGGRGR